MGLQTAYIEKRHLGVIEDIAPEEVSGEFWTDAVNVSFGNGCTERVEGYSPFADTMLATEEPLYAGSVGFEGTIQYWIYFTTDQVWVTDGTLHFDITPVGGLIPTDAGDWTFDVLGGIPVFNNSNNPPMYWPLDTATPAAVLPGWPSTARCKSLRAVKYHLVALGILDNGTYYPNQVWWSNGAQAGAIPDEWIPTAENDAGDTILSDTPGNIIDASKLRDQLIIYKTSSTYTMQYVAGQYVFATRLLFPNIGCQSLNTAVELDGQQWVFTGEDVIRHDGQNFTSMIDQKVQRTFVQRVDGSRAQMCCVVARVVEHQIWVCIPQVGADYLSYALIINTDDGLIGSRSLPSVSSVVKGTVNPAGAVAQDTWDTDIGVWDEDVTIWTQSTYSPTNDSLMMTQPDSSRLLAVGIDSAADGGPIESRLERLSLKLSDSVKHSVLTQVVPRIEGNPGDIMQVRLGYQNWLGQPITWLPVKNFVIGQSRAVSQIVDGRYLSIEFLLNTKHEWKMYGYFVKTKEAGEY